MSKHSELDDYASLIGRLVANFQSLEFTLRAFLYNKKDGEHTEFNTDMIHNAKVGDVVPINVFTDYDQLRELITRYNELVRNHHPELQVDDSIVKLRDGLAHGRIARKSQSEPLRMIKYGPIDDKTNQTTVTFSEELTPDWLNSQINLIKDALFKVKTASGLKSNESPCSPSMTS